MTAAWDRIDHMNAHAALKPASGGKRYHWRAAKRHDAPKGSWERLTAETWVEWRGACTMALETFRRAVNPQGGALLAPGETAENMVEDFR